MNKAKCCPVCNSSDLKWVYYAPPASAEPEMWEEDEDGGYWPVILFKRIECAKCHATVPFLAMTLDEAIDIWNMPHKETGKRCVMQRFPDERVSGVEQEVQDGEM